MAEGKNIDHSDPQQVEKKDRLLATREKRIQNGITLVLSHPDSRLWLYSMLEEAGPFQDAFATNSSLTAYQCGKQAWAKRLTAILLESHAENYKRMMVENQA